MADRGDAVAVTLAPIQLQELIRDGDLGTPVQRLIILLVDSC
ncbi:hypothetical protein [Actinophytocola xanthii]|nr:hypothetical protein [Actinophytocola xanthii]